MSASPEPPERLAEILLEILALSKPRASQSASARDSNQIELFGPHCPKEQSQNGDQEDHNRQSRTNS
jgi:hypothetical protein